MALLVADDGSVYREFSQTFTGETERQKIAVKMMQANGPLPESDLIVAVGIKSAAIALNSRFPVLCVLVSKNSYEKLLYEHPERQGRNITSAIYLDQPSRRHVNLIAAVLPDAKDIGLLFSAPSSDVANVHKAVAGSRFVLREKNIDSTDSLYRDLQALLLKSDVLLAIPDAQIYNPSTMRNILLSTYRAGVPVVGYSSAYVRAGALCAVFSTPEQLAIQAAYVTRQFFETQQLPAAQYPVDFEVMLNQQVARSLTIPVRENAMLVRQIKEAENAGAVAK